MSASLASTEGGTGCSRRGRAPAASSEHRYPGLDAPLLLAASPAAAAFLPSAPPSPCWSHTGQLPGIPPAFKISSRTLGWALFAALAAYQLSAADKVTCGTKDRAGGKGSPTRAVLWDGTAGTHSTVCVSACVCVTTCTPHHSCAEHPGPGARTRLDAGLAARGGGRLLGRGGLAGSSFFKLNIVACAFIRLGFLRHVICLIPPGRQSVRVGDLVSEWVIINC